MQQLLYIHGGSAYSDYEAFLEHLRTVPLRDLPGSEPRKKWTESFATDLGADFEVFTPNMPNSQNATYEEWKIWFERYAEHLHDGVVLLGWSQGGYFLAKYLIENELSFQPSALFLLAAPFEAEDFGGEDGGDFAFDTSRTHELADKIPTIHLFHSVDDPIVPYVHAEKYAAALPEAILHTYTDKNHFLVPEFPELLEEIRKHKASS